MKNFFKDHLIKYFSFPPVELKFPIDWHQNPYQNSDWQWNLHCLGCISPLIDDWRRGNKEALDLAIEIATSWIDTFRHTPVEKFPKYVWHDHSTALRALQFCKLYAACAKEKTTVESDFLLSLRSALEKHAELLMDKTFYRRHTNHGMDQAYALLCIGQTLERQDYMDCGRMRILDEFAFAFSNEGVHKENSPHYHRGCLERFVNIFAQYREIFAQIEEDFLERANAALMYLAYILTPEAKFPIIGDSIGVVCRKDMNQILASLPAYKHFLFSASKGRMGVPPMQLQKVYPESGYAIFRDAWHNSESFDETCQVIVKSGSVSRYHYHMDEGNVVMRAYDEDWLIDSGLYSYDYSDPKRILATSRYGHNVPVVPESVYHADEKHKFSAWRVNSWSENPVNPYIDMEHSCLVDITMKRRVEFDAKTVSLSIRDVITLSGGGQKLVEILFHVPKDKYISLYGNHIDIKSQKKILRLDFSSSQFLSCHVTAGAEHGDNSDSIVSYEMWKWEPSQCIHVCLSGEKKLSAQFDFKFFVP